MALLSSDPMETERIAVEQFVGGKDKISIISNASEIVQKKNVVFLHGDNQNLYFSRV
jgi:hypothetical protein